MSGFDFVEFVDSLIRRITLEWRQAGTEPGAQQSVAPCSHVDPVVSLITDIHYHNLRARRLRTLSEVPVLKECVPAVSDALGPENAGATELEDLLVSEGIVAAPTAGTDALLGRVICQMSECYLELSEVLLNWDCRSSVSGVNDVLARYFSLKLRAAEQFDGRRPDVVRFPIALEPSRPWAPVAASAADEGLAEAGAGGTAPLGGGYSLPDSFY